MTDVRSADPNDCGCPQEDQDEVYLAYLVASEENRPDVVARLLQANPWLASIVEAEQFACQQANVVRRAWSDRVPLGPFGGYDLEQVIDVGGMGVVYRAHQRIADRHVALKVIRSGALATRGERDRFLEEVRVQAGLIHENIVRIYEVGEHDGHPYFSMELARGTLADQVPGLWKDPRKVAELMIQVAHGVNCAHRHGILHRDLKPANILLTDGDVLRVADFGLARRVETSGEASAASPGGDPRNGIPGVQGLVEETGPYLGSVANARRSIEGTPPYMAPEQARGDTLTVAVDVYGMGAVLYELLTGQPPHRGETVQETLDLVRAGSCVPPRKRNPRVDPNLEAICLRCLRTNPGERYPSAAEVATVLTRFLQGKPVCPVHPGVRLAMWVRRQPVAAALVGALVLTSSLLLAGIGVLVHSTIRRQAEDRWNLYRQSLAVIDRHLFEILTSQPGAPNAALFDRIARTLRDCPEEHRHWEYHYIRRLITLPRIHLAGHTRPVVSIEYHRDGRRILTGAGDGTARLWDAETGEMLHIFPGYVGPVRAGFLGDGKRIFTSAQDQPIRFWDASTGKQLSARDPDTGKEVPHRMTGDMVVCDGAGKWLVTGNKDQKLTLYDQATLTERRQEVRPDPFIALAISPNGRYLALGSYHTPLQVLEIHPDPKEPTVTPVPVAECGVKGTIWAVAFSRDSRYLAAGPEQPVFWELPRKDRRECQVVRELGGVGSLSPASLNYSPDGHLAVVYRDDTVRVYDGSTGKLVRTPEREGKQVKVATFSPDGNMLAVGWGAVVELDPLSYHPETFRVWKDGTRRGAGQSLRISREHSTIAARFEDGGFAVWDVQKESPIWSGFDPRKGAVLALRGSSDQIVACRDGQIQGWSLSTGKWAGLSLPIGPFRCAAQASNKDHLLAAAKRDREITVIDLHDQTEWSFDCNTPDIRLMALSPNGQLLALGGTEEGKVTLFRLNHDRRTAEPVTPQPLSRHKRALHALTFSPDGKLLASGGADHNVHLLDIATRKTIKLLQGEGIITGVAFTPDGKRIAACSREGIKIWDVHTGADLITLMTSDEPVIDIAFSPNGHCLYSCGRDGRIRVWDGRPF